jgi:hypothetical protein
MKRLWFARICIGLVFFANVQCALAFLWVPQDYASSFELEGVIGDVVVRALGVLFLMWNVPYAVALWHPVRHRLSLWEAFAMQAIGVVGETLIFGSLPAGHVVLHSSIERYILFDGAGLALLLVAVWLTKIKGNQ